MYKIISKQLLLTYNFLLNKYNDQTNQLIIHDNETNINNNTQNEDDDLLHHVQIIEVIPLNHSSISLSSSLTFLCTNKICSKIYQRNYLNNKSNNNNYIINLIISNNFLSDINNINNNNNLVVNNYILSYYYYYYIIYLNLYVRLCTLNSAPIFLNHLTRIDQQNLA